MSFCNQATTRKKKNSKPIKLKFTLYVWEESSKEIRKTTNSNDTDRDFSHGQLYVACPRVEKPSSLVVYAPDQKTKSIVYERALEN